MKAIATKPRTRRPSRKLEDTLQKACVRYMAYQYPGIICFHPANGGKRNYFEAAKFKAMGVVPGIPDLVICRPRGMYGALFVELKAGKNSTTDIQDEVIRKLKNSGYYVAVARSLDEFIRAVNTYLMLNSDR